MCVSTPAFVSARVFPELPPGNSAWWTLELAGKFPKRRKLSQNSVAWLESDIAAWGDSRPAVLRGTPPGRRTIASA
jgi:hypothetical protein